MNFTLNQLQIYLKIVETNSITKASELLHLSQPAVSIQLKKFQEQFDISLTEVVGRKLYITDFGKEIGEVVQEIIEQMNTINYKMLEHKGKLSGRLRISVVSTGKYVMPYFLSDFLSKNSGVQLQMDVTNKFKVVESLERNEVDFALVSLLPNHLNIEKMDLMENKLHWIGKKQPEKSILKEKEQGLHGWFARRGGKGKSKGWVDCNTCRDGKCKSCGRQEGEERSKYPRCRPTPAQCKGYKKPD
jgi:DNA-binding transcriptional LysR family regulator